MRYVKKCENGFRTSLHSNPSPLTLDASGHFFEPFLDQFPVGEQTGILDWYTIPVGVQALLVIMMHGGLWVQYKANGSVSQRATRVTNSAWWGVLMMTVLLTFITFRVQPKVTENFRTWLIGYILPLLAIAGLAGVQFELRRKNQLNAFFSSALICAACLLA